MADHPLSKPSLPKKESKIKPPSKNGDVIFGALVKLAALITLLLLGGIIVSLFIASLPSIQKFGFPSCGPKSGTLRPNNLARWFRFTALSSPRLLL